MKHHSYLLKIYGEPPGNAAISVRAASAIEAVQHQLIAIFGEKPSFGYTQINHNSNDEAERDNAHVQWRGGHAGIYAVREYKGGSKW